MPRSKSNPFGTAHFEVTYTRLQMAPEGAVPVPNTEEQVLHSTNSMVENNAQSFAKAKAMVQNDDDERTMKGTPDKGYTIYRKVTAHGPTGAITSQWEVEGIVRCRIVDPYMGTHYGHRACYANAYAPTPEQTAAYEADIKSRRDAEAATKATNEATKRAKAPTTTATAPTTPTALPALPIPTPPAGVAANADELKTWLTSITTDEPIDQDRLAANKAKDAEVIDKATKTGKAKVKA